MLAYLWVNLSVSLPSVQLENETDSLRFSHTDFLRRDYLAANYYNWSREFHWKCGFLIFNMMAFLSHRVSSVSSG
jgi:hypothetical protein